MDKNENNLKDNNANSPYPKLTVHRLYNVQVSNES